MMKSLVRSLIFVVGGLAVAIASSDLDSSPSSSLSTRQSTVKTVSTTSGLVSGHASSNASAGVAEYLGIPYAQPPVGDLRFAPPVQFNGTAGINGTNFGFSCPTTTAYEAGGGSTSDFDIQFANLTAAGIAILTGLGQIGDRFSEDCLTLNVWVPSGGEANKAALLWIYGGGFSSGSTDTATYNGQNLASQEDVIVVSINYRLNIFGFPGNPSLPNLNLGLLDQRLAIEWARDNIPAFGGDASRITIFGQSAGSASVDYYSYAYVSDPIVAGMIQESGTINGFGTVTPGEANSAWFNVTATVGCGNASSNTADVLTCMRTKTAADILNAIPAAAPGAITGGLSAFGPAVDNITVFGDYDTRSAAGNFIKVPILMGNCDYEAGLFATIAALANVTYSQSFWDEFDLSIFTCPAAERANISIAAGVPTWRYRYFGDFPNLRLTSIPDSGAWHASELPLVFGNYPSPTNGVPNATDAEISIGNYIRGAWAAFAKNPTSGLTSYQGGWPGYDPSSSTLLRLAYQNLTGTNLAAPLLYDAACPVKFAYNGTGTASATPSPTSSPTSTASPPPPASSSTSASAAGRVSASSTIPALAIGAIILSVVSCLS